MKLRHIFLGTALVLSLAAPLLAQKARTPAPGTDERKSLMDLLRGPVVEHYGKYFTDSAPVFTVRHLKVAGDWAYAEVTTQAVTVQPGEDLLENMSSVDANAGSSEKAAKWTIDAWALYEKTNEGWGIVFHSTDERAKDYDVSLDGGRAAAYKDMRKKYQDAPRTIFPQ